MTINEICKFTGFSREALTTRQQRWSLGKDVSCKDLLQLRPLNDPGESNLTLEQARRDLTLVNTAIAEQTRDENDGRLVDVDTVLAHQNTLLEGIVGIIKSSSLDETGKEDLADLIKDHGKKWHKAT